MQGKDMSDSSDSTAASAKAKKPIQILRERRGGVPRELLERNRQQNVIRQRLTGMLQGGPKTVSELASEVGLPAHKVLWYVMGMKKYGKVAESDQVDGYFQYRLIDKPRPTEKTS